MTLDSSVILWEYQNKSKYFQDIIIDTNQRLDKNALLDYLLYEFGSMRTVDTDSNTFHDRVRMFFDIHRWNIDKLSDSQNLDYDTLGNVDWKQVTDYDRSQDVHTSEERDINVDELRTDDTDVSRNETTDVDRNESINTKEKGSDNSTDTNYVSAFNDNDDDTKHHRDVHQGSYDKEIDTTDSETTDTVDKETVDTDETETINRKTDDDLETQQNLGELIDVTITKKGHDNNFSYQQLIEEERKQAEFNLYKWIGRHFCKELLIALW